MKTIEQLINAMDAMFDLTSISCAECGIYDFCEYEPEVATAEQCLETWVEWAKGEEDA